MAQRQQQFPQEELEKIRAVKEAERIVQGEKGYVTKEELERLRRDVEQFLRWLSVTLLAYTNIGSEEDDS